MGFSDSSGGKFFKIGICGSSVRDRRTSLQSGTPFKLKIEKIFNVSKRISHTALEKMIHEELSEYRMIGEWFRSTDASEKLFYEIIQKCDDLLSEIDSEEDQSFEQKLKKIIREKND